eukprot:jgi/Chrzof1/10893/Cz05g16060.t1
MLARTTCNARCFSAARPVPAFVPSVKQVRRISPLVVRAQDPNVGNEDSTGKDAAGPDQMNHEGRESPMSQTKAALAEQQGRAPEGDKAVIGQRAQPTGAKAYSETPEQRYGSKEGYEKAMEAAKDKTRRSELQTGDDQQWQRDVDTSDSQGIGGAGNSGEGEDFSMNDVAKNYIFYVQLPQRTAQSHTQLERTIICIRIRAES